jgi:hypothetical protein
MGNTNSKKPFGTINDQLNPRPGYYFNNGEVWYQGKEINKLPQESNFKKLGYSYMKSNDRVFYKGSPIPGAHPTTFTTVNRNKISTLTSNFGLTKLNSVIGMDYFNNKKRFYHKGQFIHSEE